MTHVREPRHEISAWSITYCTTVGNEDALRQSDCKDLVMGDHDCLTAEDRIRSHRYKIDVFENGYLAGSRPQSVLPPRWKISNCQ